ncbi:MAG TPA: methyltransferase domain-containing protein [Propionibacteriaceae bacterium]|nr:methyltransferase domain-containing protein [Propionibacteriaceae bacterium]
MPEKKVDSDQEPEWTWDPSLYAGSAVHYAVGRVAYPAEVVEVLVTALQLDGSGRLLDIGCGPGSLTLLLAPYFEEVIGVDADADMLNEAARLADEKQVINVAWRHLRGEDLPADLPPGRLIAFAQSFHWMDRPQVASAARGLLTPDGALVHLHATTHQGTDTDEELPHPRPPREAITELAQHYLGPQRRAGQGVLSGGTPGGEEMVYRAAGFAGPQRLEVPGRRVERTADQVVSSVYSLSSSAPHLFGERLEEFDAELRRMLAQSSADGLFCEQMGYITLDIWR